MKCVLSLAADPLVCIDEMKDGDLAVVLKWGYNEVERGTIIMRLDNAIIPLGKDSAQQYRRLLTLGSESLLGYQVRILGPGDVIMLKSDDHSH